MIVGTTLFKPKIEAVSTAPVYLPPPGSAYVLLPVLDKMTRKLNEVIAAVNAMPKPREPVCPRCQRSMELTSRVQWLTCPPKEEIWFACHDCRLKARRAVEPEPAPARRFCVADYEEAIDPHGPA